MTGRTLELRGKFPTHLTKCGRAEHGNLLGKHGEKRHISEISGGIPSFYMKYCARWCEIKNKGKNRKTQEKWES
jgi:hypothetical protein